MSLQVYLLSLGCAKNQVDSEIMSGSLQNAGFTMTGDPAQADVIMINTCGFIEDAQKESIAAILELAAYKRQGRCRLLVAVGCMCEKFAAEMAESMPELDLTVGVGKYAEIGALLAARLQQTPPQQPLAPYLLRDLSATVGSAYLKIAEGCNNRCSYCLIPDLRGPYVSRPQTEILAEADRLLTHGVKELVVIAQDPTRYGLDLCGRPLLPELLDELAARPFAMIRLLYVYPQRVDDALLKVMAAHDNICPYLDLPVQHAAAGILRAMNRGGDAEQLLARVAAIRAALPDAALRTTVMVGFPGETKADFDQLLDFLEQARFDWVGAFAFSPQEGTPAATLPRQVAEATKRRRLDLVMQQAARITEERLRRHVGQVYPVLAEKPAPEFGPGLWSGRSRYQAPEVDGVVLFPAPAGRPVQPGELYQVRITATQVYDLVGEIVS